MKTRTNTIAYRLEQVKRQNELIEKLGKFLKTEKGPKVVNDLYKYPTVDLCKKYGINFMLYTKNTTYIKNLIVYCINKYEIKAKPVVEYPEIKIEKRKLPENLTKEEIKLIMSKKPKARLGRAALLHGYEVAKIAKWEKRHPKPTDVQLKEDLFPETLITGWKTQRTIALEHIRKKLCEHYFDIPYKKEGMKLYVVHKSISTFPTIRKIFPNGVESEVDQADMFHPFYLPSIYNDPPAVIMEKLRAWALHSGTKCPSVIGYKLYNDEGRCLYKIAA